MSNFINQNESIIAANRVTPSENNNYDKNTESIIHVNKSEEDEDGQNILTENSENNRINKNNSEYVGDEKYSDSSLSWRDLYPQVLASFISLLMVIQPGINLAYSNNLLHHMPSLNNGQFSWITSVVALSTPVGAIVIGFVMDKFGRKRACVLTCILLLVSWTISVFTTADRIYLFFAFRLLAGIGAGMTTVGMVYVSEISHSSYKQLLLSLNSVFFSGGILISTSIAQLQLNIINSAFIGFTIINIMLIIIYMPESPIWILKFKHFDHAVDEAKSAMKQIYPKNKQVYEKEWARLRASCTSPLSSSSSAAATGTQSFFRSVRSSPAAYKPMAILTVLLLFQQLSGAYPSISYALPILKTVAVGGGGGGGGGGGDTLIGEIGSLAVLGAIRFVAAILTCLLSFYVGRKPLLTVSCVGMALSSALVTVTGPQSSLSSSSLSLCGVMSFVLCSSLGVLVFPWTMICELLPTEVRAVGGCLLVSFAYLVMFATLMAFPYVLAALSVSRVYTIFGAVSLLAAVYVHLVVPETLGKSFQEIEAHFTRRDKRDERDET